MLFQLKKLQKFEVKMDICGWDRIFKTNLSPKESADVVATLAKGCWQDAIFEKAGDKCPQNMFIYENQESKALWDIDVPDGEANMIYALFDSDTVTVPRNLRKSGFDEINPHPAVIRRML